MAAIYESNIERALELLREGKIQDADNLLSAFRQDLAREAAGGEPAPPPPPRDPADIGREFAGELVALLGSPAPLVALLQEYDACTAAAAAKK